MIKKTVTFEDYNGNKRTEDLYFHLSKIDCVRWELSREGGMSEVIKRVTSSQKIGEIFEILEDVLFRSYGVKSLDGRRFDKALSKRDDIWLDFVNSPAYEAFLWSMVNPINQDGGEKLAAFFDSLIPEFEPGEKEHLIALEKQNAGDNNTRD